MGSCEGRRAGLGRAAHYGNQRRQHRELLDQLASLEERADKFLAHDASPVTALVGTTVGLVGSRHWTSGCQ